MASAKIIFSRKVRKPCLFCASTKVSFFIILSAIVELTAWLTPRSNRSIFFSLISSKLSPNVADALSTPVDLLCVWSRRSILSIQRSTLLCLGISSSSVPLVSSSSPVSRVISGLSGFLICILSRRSLSALSHIEP